MSRIRISGYKYTRNMARCRINERYTGKAVKQRFFIIPK
nr:MAG TPA: hypothetical protein [Caudoviricetes sp.]DAT51884.1 MAG TPA: hypothetical protein [Caudoviricetes sp.]